MPLERLRDEVVRTFLHRLDGRLHGSVCRHENDFRRRRELLRRLEKPDAVHSRHLQVGEHDRRTLAPHEVESLVARRRLQHAKALFREHVFERDAVPLVVVDDQESRVGRVFVRHRSGSGPKGEHPSPARASAGNGCP
jgi:hypothetical protein